MVKRRRIDPDVKREIERLAVFEELNGAQIERRLNRSGQFANVPGIRTIQDIVKEVRPSDPSGMWSVHHADPATAKLVLETIAKLMVITDGKVRGVTNGLADRIIMVHTICPDMPVADVYRVAWLYNVRRLNEESTDDLDMYLAFAPWDDNHGRYGRAIGAGWITPPSFVTLQGLGEWLKEKNIGGVNVKGTDHG